MDGANECGPTLSSRKPPPTSDDEQSEKKDDPSEDSNLKTLKKARFVWQIKGNYHLKNSNCDTESKESSSCPASEASCSEDKEIIYPRSDSPIGEPIMETQHSTPVCDHHPPSSQPGADTASTSEDLYPPLPPLRIGPNTVSCVVCDTFNENIRRASLRIDGERSTTPPLPTSHPDWNVRKWQTRQIAKAFMDNTINSVLEEMGFTPVPESAPDSDPDDVLGSINFGHVDDESVDEEDESVENEGILSAIQRHGLQRHTLQTLSQIRFTSNSPPLVRPPLPGASRRHRKKRRCPLKEWSTSKQESDLDESTDGHFLDEDDEEDESDTSSVSTTEEYELNHYWDVSSDTVNNLDEQIAEAIKSGLYNEDPPSNYRGLNEKEHNKSEKASKAEPSDSQEECLSKLTDEEDESCKKRQGNDINSSSICKRRCVESTDEDSKSSSSSSLHMRNSPLPDGGAVSVTSQSSDGSSPTFGHFEFMDAAVAAAIQKKGLSALACQDL